MWYECTEDTQKWNNIGTWYAYVVAADASKNHVGGVKITYQRHNASYIFLQPTNDTFI